MPTFLDLKNQIRRDIWSSGEPRSRVTAHNHWFIDALIEVQKYVECWQQNNTHLVPHCATRYNCGLTSFDFPRAHIKRLSVVSATLPDAPEPALIGDSDDSVDGSFYSAFGGEGVSCQEVTPSLLAFRDWTAINTDTPAYLKWKFDLSKVVTEVTIDMMFGQCQNVTFTVQKSDDNATWTTIKEDADQTWSNGDTVTIEVTAVEVGAIYWRVLITPTTIAEPLMGWVIGGATILGYNTVVTTLADIDWCSSIDYVQIEPCAIRNYLSSSKSCGSCLPLHLYFGFPAACISGKGVIPVPTDEGVPGSLASLPLGYHYPQQSTDSSARATHGVWAIENGTIFIAPWIQSTETVVLRWDGIKRDWSDSDLLDNDPELIKTVLLYVSMQKARFEDRDLQVAADFERQYNLSLQGMWHECREETRVRECESSHARGTTPITLYFNDAQQYTANCPSNKTGDPVTETVSANTVSSSVSKADANQKAWDQAKAQAEAKLDCDEAGVTYWNSPQTYTASCEQEDGAPVPDSKDMTVTIQAGEYSSTVSQDVADKAALAAAKAQAESLLECVWYNREKTVTLTCPSDEGESVSATVLASDPECDSTVSQDDADNLATTKATELATAKLATDCTTPSVLETNDSIINYAFTGVPCVKCTIYGSVYNNTSYVIYGTVFPGLFSGTTKAEANAKAMQFLTIKAMQYKSLQLCPQTGFNYPPCPAGNKFVGYVSIEHFP